MKGRIRTVLEQSTFWRLVSLVRPFVGRMVMALLLGFATVSSGIGLLATSAYIISRAALHPSIAVLHVPIAGVRFFGITRGVFRYGERLTSHDVAFRLLKRLRVWFYTTLEPLAPARLERFRSGDLLTRIVSDVESLEHFFVRVIAPPLVALLTLFLMWGILMPFSTQLALGFTCCVLIAAIGLPVMIRHFSRRLGAEMLRIRSALKTLLVDTIQGNADLLTYGRKDAQLMRIHSLGATWARQQMHMAHITGLQSGLMSFLAYLTVVVALFVVIPLARSGQVDGVYLAVIVMAILASFEAIIPLPGVFQHLDGSLAAARRLFEIVDAEPEVRDVVPASPPVEDYSVTVRGLSFRYGDNGPLALSDVSFHVPEGGKLAIVGPSGAGKSTLVNILLRFWDYHVGEIYLGGHELRTYRQEDVRRLLGVISQHTYLFAGTIRENLLLARPDATEADIIWAAKQAQIHSFIESLPNGYDTWIGEQGLQLSGGQRQRIAIARALLKDAPILILDEATANLDSLVEQELMDAIFRLMKGRTMIIITHRLVGLERVDEIVVLSHGRVVEQGTHMALLARNGIYRHLWQLQHQAHLLDSGK